MMSAGVERAQRQPVGTVLPSRTVVRVRNLGKSFSIRRGWGDLLRRRGGGQAVAVDSVNLEVSSGEILALLGPNGAGKTTLLKMLATLVLPDRGSAEVCGYDVVREAREVRRRLAPVTADERSLDWRLSARENLRFFGALHGLRGTELRSRIESLLGIVELASAAQKIVAEFSSGMRQRLLIARALMTQPSVLLLDEPTRSLDPLAARSFRAFLRREIAGVQGCTVLLATHDAEEALELSDRIAVLDRGRLLAAGTRGALASRFSEARYRLWARDLSHRAFVMAAARGIELQPCPAHDDEEGAAAEIRLGGEDRPDDVLSLLVRAGAPIIRFEKVQPPLAELIERIVAQETFNA